MASCACNDRLHLEADRVARNPRMPQKTREDRALHLGFATALPASPPRFRRTSRDAGSGRVGGVRSGLRATLGNADQSRGAAPGLR